MMKRFVILLVAALALPLAAVAQYEAYQNLSAVSPSGHTLYYTIVDGHAEVAPQYWGLGQSNIGYYATSLTGNVIIPSRVTLQGNSYDVTAIGPDAFHYCDAMQSVTMPSSITSIGLAAFTGCAALTTVNFSENITRIDYAAFSRCTSLTTLTLPASLTTMENSIFAECTGLTSVVIPSSVTSMIGNIFYGCSGLASITVENGNTVYDSRGGCNAIIETRTNTLVVGCKNTVIPNTVTSIGDNAYAKCSGLTSLNIPSSVTSIGEFSFAYCNGLTSLYIPDWVTTIGEEAFFYCEGLNSVTIGNSVTSIGEKAFFYCTGLNMLTIGSSVTRIENQAFDYCSNLMSITCMATVPPTAGTNAFRGVPANATVFVPCASLGAYQSANGWREFTDMQGMPELEFDAAVTSGQVLHFTVNLDGTTVTVSGHVDDISGDLIIPSTISYCGNNYDVTAIGQDAFQNCDEMVSITMPNSVVTIGSSAFLYCQSLTTVNFSENLTSIDDNAFNYCTSLTAPTFPASLTSIGSGAFAYCYSLSPIICQATVPPTAGVEAFLEVPTYATIIVPCASRGAYQLANEWSNFTGIIGGDRYTESTSTDQTLVYILDCANGTATVMGYEGECSGALEIPSSITVNEVSYSVTRIADNAFSNNTGITSLTIPSGLTYIGDSAFIECTSLNSVNVNLFGNYLDTIGKMAFWRCYNLSTFNFYPCYNLKYIGDAAFGFCNLTTLRFRENLQNVGEDRAQAMNPFRFCPINFIYGDQNEYYRYENNTIINKALNEVVAAATTAGVPTSVTSIRTAAYASTALRKIVVPEGVTKIGLSFIYDGSVDSLLLPSTLTDLHYYALDGCATLKYIEFAEGIQNVPGFGVGMYSSESTPEEIVLPSTTTNIGHISIYNGLQRVVCKALVPPTFAYSTYDFNSQNADDLLTIIVPCESVDAYRNADVWSRYNIQGVDCTPIPEGPTNISVNVDGNAVVVEGATGNTVTLYNANGDVVASRTAPAGEPLRFESLTTGTYYVKIGILPVRMKVEVR